MCRDPAVASIKQLVHAGQLCERDHRPSPPNLPGEKDYGIRAGDIAAIVRQNMHFFERGPGLEGEPLHYPFCLQWEKEIASTPKNSTKPSGRSGAGWAFAII